MRGRIAHKLRSEQGASMSMALMLFLVCTVVASITITAASASAGRLSQLRETDKAYYNVTSAANLFWDLMKEKGSVENGNGVSVKVVRTCTVSGSPNRWEYSNVTFEIDDRDFINSGVSTDTRGTPTATLFEALICDALLHVTSSDGDLTRSDIEATFNTTTSEPSLRDTDFSKINRSFKINPSTDVEDYITPINVTVRGEESGIVIFSFDEGSESKSYCTLVARIEMIDKVVPSNPSEGGNQTYSITYGWTPMYVSSEG